jgi:hypothetical protein
MPLQLLIERFFSITLLATGVSHLLQPRLWHDFFLLLKRSGVAGIIIAMFTFPLGLTIVLGHNVWVWGVPVIYTLCGWGMTIKSLSYVLIRGRAEKMIAEGAEAHLRYAWAGGLMIPFSLLLVYYAFFRAA